MGMVLLDNEGKIVEINKRMYEILDAGERDYKEKNPIKLIRDNNINKAISQVVSGEEVYLEGKYISNKQKIIFFKLNGSPVFTKNNQLIGSVLIIEDITERENDRKQYEDKLNEYNKLLETKLKERSLQLEEKSKEFERFALNISHELVASNRVIQGYIKAIKEDFYKNIPELGQKYILRIDNATVYQDTMINSLLNFSRISNSDVRMHTLNLEKISKEIVKHYFEGAISENAEINIICPMSVVISDHDVLIQIISNLLSNAVKFVEKGKKPKIEIFTSETSEYVYYNVKDNGIGIPSPKLKLIFEAFERLHGIESYPGIGIGLSIVKKATERINARIEVESEIGKGSTFRLCLKK
jgi:PAS domain S-box-containing protein